MDLLKPIFSALDVIREESSARQVCLGIWLGGFLSFNPAQTPQFLLAFFLLCILRVNLVGALVSWFFFSLLSLPMTSYFDSLGRYLLVDIPALRRLWAGLYHWPIFPFTQFNNTVVMGGLAFYLAISIPMYVSFYWIYRKWSHSFFEKVQDSLFGNTLKASQFFRYYGYHISNKNRQKQ